MKESNNESLENLRHSASHLLAAAVMELWPDTKRTIGPVIETGFYYDFDFSKPISDSDLPAIEKKMHELVKSWKRFERKEVSASDAKKEYQGNPYKLELIDEFSKDGQKLTFYTSGDYTDLCRGGHCEHPSKDLKHFKLMSIAGAYWRGSEKNQMLTRIYGTAFPSKKELDDYLAMLEEAKKRDHRKLGAELELFMFHETSPGSPYWLPKGLVLINELVQFWREEHRMRGYQEIASPLVNKRELWQISGHWDHYKGDMFIATMGENEVYGLKPMNCPNAMIVFASKTRSYKDLPLRLSDTDILHRYELSGTLGGLLRARSFRQDDSHNFVTEDQIADEYERIFEIAERFYGVFKLQFRYRLGTRPEKFLGDAATWDRAEKALTSILDKKVGTGKYEIAEKDGAFYGPKVDIIMKDALGRDWQMGTIQLDFQQPQRFGLKYTAPDGTAKTPIAIHRVIYGSLERFIGIITESFAGSFPLWLSPEQVRIAVVGKDHRAFCHDYARTLMQAGIRVTVDDSNETVGNKIRKASNEKIPFTLVIGDKEMKSEELAVRTRGAKDVVPTTRDRFISMLQQKIADRAIDLTPLP